LRIASSWGIGPVQMVRRYIRDSNLFRDNSAGNWDSIAELPWNP
jgi:hypothetical protein